MKIDRPFNQLSKQEYLQYISNHKEYKDFNTLGLYRSLLENKNLTDEERIIIRDFANTYFQKTFEFLQLKDPYTYFKVITLGEILTRGDELSYWNQIRTNQERILKDKKIKHRNFGTYSKHDCGYENCPYNGLMIKPGSSLKESCMFFITDEDKFSKKEKSLRLKKEQRKWKRNRKNDFE